VHCLAGISRSATICMAYLMQIKDMSLDQAHDYLKQRRRLISPNLNFLRQLAEFETALASRGSRRVSSKSDEFSVLSSEDVIKQLQLSELSSSVSAAVGSSCGVGMSESMNFAKKITCSGDSFSSARVSEENARTANGPAHISSTSRTSSHTDSSGSSSVPTVSGADCPATLAVSFTNPTTTTTNSSSVTEPVVRFSVFVTEPLVRYNVSTLSLPPVRWGSLLKSSHQDVTSKIGLPNDTIFNFESNLANNLGTPSSRKRLRLTASDLLGPCASRPRSSNSSMIPSKHACFTFDFPVVSGLASSPTVCHSPLLSPS